VQRNPPEPIDKTKLFHKARPKIYPPSWLVIKARLAQGLPLKKRQISEQQLWDQFTATTKYQAVSPEQRKAMWEEYFARATEA